MRPIAVLITAFLVSGFLATDARLRNKDETTSCENEDDFECKPGDCIDRSLTCNSVYDCASLADEAVQLCGCAPDEFQCHHTCIPLEMRCDSKCDCKEDCADEEHCESYRCLPGYNKCDNHMCVPHFFWCDFKDDCQDGSDERNCIKPKCWTTQFTCQSEQCINYFFICDGIPDCVDGSDETPDFCSEGNFVDCGDGTRVHSEKFCDNYVDCKVSEADETNNCICEEQQTRCSNGKCIWKAQVCDRRCDCLDCGDEVNCSNKDDCNIDDHIFCPFFKNVQLPTCLAKEYLCDGRRDCIEFQADESDCSETCSMDNLCGPDDNRCLLQDAKCNGEIQCLSGTDEANCTVPECDSDSWQCARGGNCIPASYRCDQMVDCFDGSDEEHCESFPCSEGQWKCDAGHCINPSKVCDYRLDCFYHVGGRRDTSDEDDCEEIYSKPCRDDQFRCMNGQCIDGWRRCYADRDDDIYGCADRSNLRNCRHFECEAGQFKCSRSHCLDKSLVCDIEIHCIESWDDEALPDDECAIPCPLQQCLCFGPKQTCEDAGLDVKTLDIKGKENNRITHFYLRGNNLAELIENKTALEGMERIVALDLSDNGITYINGSALRNMPSLNSLILADNNIMVLESNTFLDMGIIKTLDFKGNHIHTIEENAFEGLRELTTLDLSGQNITSIVKGTFKGLHKVTNLNLSNNILSEIVQGAFFGLPDLSVLDISNNRLRTLYASAFYGLPKLRILHTDDYSLCCALQDIKTIEECTPPPPDEFSNCEDLMANVFLRGSIWVIGIIASVGNLVVIMMRMNNKRDHRFIVQQTSLGDQYPELMGPTWVHSFLITNLAIGDFLMGVYLLIIASVDAYYRGYYIQVEEEWRESNLCRFAGFLSTFSSELSVFSLTIITLHRLFSILFPFRIKDMEFSGAVRVMVVTWLLVTFLAAFPLTGLRYFGEFYGRSGVCLALHITPDWPKGWEYSVFVFLVLNFVSFITIAVSYSVMFVVARRTQKAVNRSRDGNTGDAMARRMTLIVMTDFVCWIPIILLGVASLGGAYIPPQVYAWIAVFVLPVNSAVNPMLYTLLTAPYVRRVMSRARTSLNLSLATMTTDMKQVNYTGADRQIRTFTGRQGNQPGTRTPQADANRNAIKLNTIISQSDTEPDEAGKADELTLLRGGAVTTDIDEEPRADGLCRVRDSNESMHRNVRGETTSAPLENWTVHEPTHLILT